MGGAYVLTSHRDHLVCVKLMVLCPISQHCLKCQTCEYIYREHQILPSLSSYISHWGEVLRLTEPAKRSVNDRRSKRQHHARLISHPQWGTADFEQLVKQGSKYEVSGHYTQVEASTSTFGFSRNSRWIAFVYLSHQVTF